MIMLNCFDTKFWVWESEWP